MQRIGEKTNYENNAKTTGKIWINKGLSYEKLRQLEEVVVV